MTKETLLQHIEQARAELQAASDLTPQDRDLVGNLMTDIVTHLTEDDFDEHIRDRLSGRFADQAARLEVNHPKLAGLLERVVSFLSSMGI